MPKWLKKPTDSDNQDLVPKKEAKTGVKEIDYEKLAAGIKLKRNQITCQCDYDCCHYRFRFSTDPPSQGINSESIQRRQDSGLSVDPPRQGITTYSLQRREDWPFSGRTNPRDYSKKKLVASVFKVTCNRDQSQKPFNYLSISYGIFFLEGVWGVH